MVHREPDARTVIRVRGTPADRGCKRVLEKREGFLRAVCSLPTRRAPCRQFRALPGPQGPPSLGGGPSAAHKPARRRRSRAAGKEPVGGREGRATRLERSRDGPLMHRKTETGAATRSGRGPTSAMTHGLARDDHSDRLPRVEGLSSMRWPDQPEDARMCDLPRAPPGWLTFRENGHDRNPHPICRNASPRKHARSPGRRDNDLTARTWMGYVPRAEQPDLRPADRPWA